MPLILLFHEVFDSFIKSVKKFEPWNELVDLEALLVARGRSAFLIHWFGSLIPLDGFNVRIAILNFEALRQRYSLVMSKRRSQLSEGPSVLEPLSGISGALAGAAVSPLHFLPLLATGDPYITKKLDSTFTKVMFKIAVVLNSLTWGMLGPLVFVFLAAAPVLFVGFAFVPGTAEVQDFLTAATRVAKPLADFWKLVSGPREQVKNPIVRAVLGILDRLADLFPFLMATVAFLIAKVGPLLDPLFHQFQAAGAYISAVMDLATYIVQGFMELLGNWLDPKRNDSLPHHLETIHKAFGKLVDFLAESLTIRLIGDAREWFLIIGYNLIRYLDDVQKWVIKRFWQILAENPLTMLIFQALIRLVKLGPFFDRLSNPKSTKKKEEPGKFTKALKAEFSRVGSDIDLLQMNWQTFAAPDTAAMLKKEGLSPFPTIAPSMSPAVDPFADIQTKLTKRPPSIFAKEKKALETFAIEQFDMPTAAMAVTAAHVDETRLREALLAVARRVLPPKMQPYLVMLSDAMEKAETALGQKPVPEDSRQFPVLTLADEDKLRPGISRLMVRVRGAKREFAEEWTKALEVALRGQIYPIPQPQGGGI